MVLPNYKWFTELYKNFFCGAYPMQKSWVRHCHGDPRDRDTHALHRRHGRVREEGGVGVVLTRASTEPGAGWVWGHWTLASWRERRGRSRPGPESPNLIFFFENTCFLLDIKYIRECTKSCRSVEHIQRKNSKIHIFLS